MEQKQIQQDNEYGFPYHYIPQSKNGFTQHYHWGWGKQYLSAVDFILEEVQKDIKGIDSIADVGCGDGRITKELTEKFDQSVVGIDYSERAIKLAQALVWLNKLVYNDFWIINNKKINNWLYSFYKRKYFFANQNNCGRIYLKLRKV